MYEGEYRTLSCKMFHNFNSFELKLITVLRYAGLGNLFPYTTFKIQISDVKALLTEYLQQCSVQHQTSQRSGTLFSSNSVQFVSSHSRSSQMASLVPSLLTVEGKSSDPRDSANDQKSQPRADLIRQNPYLCPAPPPPPPPAASH